MLLNKPVHTWSQRSVALKEAQMIDGRLRWPPSLRRTLNPLHTFTRINTVRPWGRVLIFVYLPVGSDPTPLAQSVYGKRAVGGPVALFPKSQIKFRWGFLE